MTLRYFNPSLLQRLFLAMLAAVSLHIGSLYDWAVFSLSSVPEPESFESLDDWKEFVLSNVSDYFAVSWYEFYLPVMSIPLLLLTPLAVANRRWLRFGGLLVTSTILMLLVLEVDDQLTINLDTKLSWVKLPISGTIYALGAGTAVSLIGGLKTNRFFWPVVAGAGVLGGLLWDYGNSACFNNPFRGTKCSPWPPFFGTIAYLSFLSVAFYVGSDVDKNQGSKNVSGAMR